MNELIIHTEWNSFATLNCNSFTQILLCGSYRRVWEPDKHLLW